MFTLVMFVLAFSSTFQYSKCENTQYQNGYQYPQNMARQTNPAMGQQVDANGNPIMQGGGMQGQPMGNQPIGNQPMGGQPMGGQPMGGQPMGNQPMGGQPIGNQPMGGQHQPNMPVNGNMPTSGGNQMIPPNGMPNQQFPQHNPAMGGTNQQFPQNPLYPGSNQQYPHHPGYPGSQQYPPVQGVYPGMNQHNPYEQPGGYGPHYPEPPHDLHLNPQGAHAYGYIMHTIESMLNDPNAKNNLFYLFNNLEMMMSNPRSTPIIQEFFNRWSRAVEAPLGQVPTNVVVQNIPSSGSFLDTLKRKAVQVGTNWANAGMQAVQGTISPFTGSTPGTTGQTIVTTPAMGTPLTVTTPMVTVQ